MSNNHFYSIQETLRQVWSDSGMLSMERAGEEEKHIALENGDIDNSRILWITVYLDGGWAKRSYGHNYDSASGLAVIVGQKTKEVLYVCVRNKFCIICKKSMRMNINMSVLKIGKEVRHQWMHMLFCRVN